MAPSLGQLISNRCKRDPVFKRQTLSALYKKLAKAVPKTDAWKRIDSAMTALENMK